MPEVTEATAEEKIVALENELLLLKPYASTNGLRLLKARLAEIYDAVHRLRGLPFEDEP